MKKIKVCLDVDGVVLNFLQTISTFIEQKYEVSSQLKYCTSQYSLDRRFGDTFIESIGFDNIKQEFEKAGYWSILEPMPEIDKIKDLFKNPMFEVSFLTSLPVHLHKERLVNLTNILGFQISEEILTCVPLGESKRPYLEKFQPDFFVEDNLNNVADCYSTHTSFWINHNENYYDESCLEKLHVVQVKNLNEAVTHIKEYLYTQDHNHIIEKIQSVLSDDLLSDKYKNLERSSKTEGHCYASAEALFHMLGGKANGLVAQVASFEENGEKLTHWWLKDKNGQILDPTADQFYAVGSKPPYELGKSGGFLTKNPSKRACEIMNRVVDSEYSNSLNNKTEKKLKIS